MKNHDKKLIIPGTVVVRKAGSCTTSTAYLLLALVAFLCTSQPVIRHALPASHDIAFHVFQAEQFTNALTDGSALPRWVAAANNGHGSPNFIFYAPLSYYCAALLNLLAGSVPAAMIATIWFSFFLSGLGMFHAASRLAGREGALVAAIMYQVLPYHLLDLYTRGTFAELFAFPWFPLILFCANGIFSAGTHKYKYAIGLSLAYAALILTHLVSGYIFSFVLFAYLVFNYLQYKSGKDLCLALGAASAGLGLSSFYLLPAALERSLVSLDYIVQCQVGDYRRNFLFLPRGYQGDLHDFYFMLHSVTVLNILLFLALFVALRQLRRRDHGPSQRHFFMVLFLSALFLATPLSRPLWEAVPGLATLQFPWRWLSMLELSACILLADLLSSRGWHSAATTVATRPVRYTLAAMAAVSLVIVAKSNLAHEQRPGSYVVAREYTPASVKNLEQLLERKQERVATIDGTASAKIVQWQGERREVEVRATTPALVRIGTSFYPGWEARLDGVKIGIDIERETGDMLIRVPQGDHKLVLKFLDTPLRAVAKTVSLATVSALLLYGILNCYLSSRRREVAALPAGSIG